jgi:prolipoprotein diacylglyceryltransferase
VQLYESAAMAAFLVYALVMLARRDAFFLRSGFYLMVLWYAGQRFCWEFFKPYAPVVGPLNLFHLICLGLIGYAVWMLARHVEAVTRRGPILNGGCFFARDGG